jgi:predicted Zn-dependent protease
VYTPPIAKDKTLMKKRIRSWLRELRHPGVALMTLLLLGVIGFGGYIAWGYYRAESHYRGAVRALDRLDFTEAQAHLRLSLRWRENPDVRFLLARTARRAGHYEEADQQLDIYEKEKGSIPEAIDLERALQRAQRGSLEGAEKPLFYYVANNHPDAVLIMEALSQGYIQAYRLPQALRFLRMWLKREPDNALALFWRGYVLEMLKSPQEALKDYRRVVEVDPTNELARLSLANLLVKESHPREALEHFELLLKNDSGNPAKVLGMVRCQMALGRGEEIRKELQEVVNRYPRNVQALYLLGKLDFDGKKPREAEPWLRKAVLRAPYEPLAVYHLAQCLKQLKKDKEAKEYLDRFNKIDRALKKLSELTKKMVFDPQNADLRFQAGKIFLDNQQDVEGLRWLSSALKEVPNHRPTHTLLANYYRQHKQPDLAARHERIAKGLAVQGPVSPGPVPNGQAPNSP